MKSHIKLKRTPDWIKNVSLAEIPNIKGPNKCTNADACLLICYKACNLAQ